MPSRSKRASFARRTLHLEESEGKKMKGKEGGKEEKEEEKKKKT